MRNLALGAPGALAHAASCSAGPASRQRIARRAWVPAPSPRRAKDVRCGAAGLGLDSQGNFVDYYEVLGIPDDATEGQVKTAYRERAKACHPDYTGDAGHNLCILLNEAYDVLSSPSLRRLYDQALDAHLEDEGAGFTGQPLSKWVGDKRSKRPEGDDRAVFVDENSCIGCKQCVWVAPAMFRIEPDFGRSRVFAQWLNSEDEITSAIDSCPVSCIHWVSSSQLPYLEYAMRYLVDRTNVGVMMAGQGGGVQDVFDAATRFSQARQRREKEMNEARKWSPAQDAARRKAAADKMREGMGVFGGAFFSSLVGSRDLAEDLANAGEDDARAERLRRREEMRERRARVPGGMREQLEVLLDRATRRVGGATVPAERALVPVRVYAEGSSYIPY